MRRVVITGVGAVSAFGIGAAALHDGLAQGRAAVGPIRSFDASAFPTRVAGELDISGTDTAFLGEAARDRKVVFGMLAAMEAWCMAACSDSADSTALVLALGLEQAFLDDFAPLFSDHRINWPARSHDALRFRSEVDLCARMVARSLGLGGQVIVNASACAAGGLAIAHAASLIERGAADVVLCGGADSMVNPFGLGGMSRLGAPSPRNTADACRPFDRRRDGLAIGEGAGMFVLESERHALERGAKPLAMVLGYGSTQDAHRATAPLPDGKAACLAMQKALARARLAPEDIGYINAHGTGTPLNDVAEARAIRAAFGSHADVVPVSSIKGAVGHLMAASGAIEAAACLLPFARSILPGTAHHQEKDPQCEIQVIGEQPVAAAPDAVLSNSFGFGGQNVALILGRWHES